MICLFRFSPTPKPPRYKSNRGFGGWQKRLPETQMPSFKGCPATEAHQAVKMKCWRAAVREPGESDRDHVSPYRATNKNAPGGLWNVCHCQYPSCQRRVIAPYFQAL
jgi:hypothetical protein